MGKSINVQLRKELVEKGHHIHTDSDTGVVAHLFMEEGTEFFNLLKGIII
ncbi:hypothetical protein [Oceanobacillus profundus]|jgi:glucosamine 6-phosphate synthetase-like amidotransferase/phosphosugar isomerase protein